MRLNTQKNNVQAYSNHVCGSSVDGRAWFGDMEDRVNIMNYLQITAKRFIISTQSLRAKELIVLHSMEMSCYTGGSLSVGITNTLICWKGEQL